MSIRNIDLKKRALSPRNIFSTLIGGYTPLFLATLMVFVPLAWMMLSSFKTPSEIVTISPKILPLTFNLENYRLVAETVPLGNFFFNSIVVTLIGSVIKVCLACMTAYALVFVHFPFKKLIFIFILVGLMVPPQVSILPNFMLISALGGQNTYWGILLPGLGTAFGTFLLRQHFKTLPKSILEAAELEGAGHIRRMVQIVIPISAPAVATVALVTIVNEWNDYIWPLIIIDKPNMMTLPVGLTLLQNSEGDSSWGVLMAGAVLVLLPVLIIFAALQRYIVAGLTAGSVTG